MLATVTSHVALRHDCHRTIITALHAMQTRYNDENSVRPSVSPSVCLYVKRVDRDKTEERSVRFLYHTKDHLT